MHLLYVDESRVASDSRHRYFVLSGVAVFERAPHWIDSALESIAARFDPHESHSIELHASPMRTGVKRWRRIPFELRDQAIKDALRLIPAKRCRLFAAILKKENFAGQDLTQTAFEQVSSRFDQYLGRLYRQGDPQRGIIVFDKCSTERRIQTLARDFKFGGHSFGALHNLAEVPLFVDSEASRLIQLADLVAYAIFRHYEFGDSSYFEIIRASFDEDGGVIHGLYER